MRKHYLPKYLKKKRLCRRFHKIFMGHMAIFLVLCLGFVSISMNLNGTLADSTFEESLSVELDEDLIDDSEIDEDPSDAEPSDKDPSDAEPSDKETSDGEPSDDEAFDGEPSDGEPSDGEPSDGEPSDGEPSDGEPSDGEPSDSVPSDGDPSNDEASDKAPSDDEQSDDGPTEEELEEEEEEEESFELEMFGMELFSAPTYSSSVSDAPTRDQASVLKFVAAETNLTGGISVDSDGKVWTWGYNAHGQQGIPGMPMNSASGGRGFNGGMTRIPYFVVNNIHVVQIASSIHTNYALDDQGVIYAWGYGGFGRMGNGTSVLDNQTPLPIMYFVNNNIQIAKIATSSQNHGFCYVISTEGKIYAWGAQGYGNLLNALTATAAQQTPFEVTALAGYDIVDFAMGNYHVLALDSSGNLFSWGFNLYGQLGIGNTANRNTPQPVNLGNKRVIAISASADRSLAVTEDGAVYQWGFTYRETGTIKNTYTHPSGAFTYTYSRSGNTTNILTPSRVIFDLDSGSRYGYTFEPIIDKITCSFFVNYAIDVYGRIWMWGYNYAYGFTTDGPLTNGVSGKQFTYLNNATLIQSMGDGNTEGSAVHIPAKTPVFRDAPLDSWTSSFIFYSRYGTWAPFDGLHPTIYDKKYCEVLEGRNPNTHQDDYLLDEQGRRIIYVVRRQNNTGTILYSGDFYVAEDSYTGLWCVDNRNTMTLPRGVTEETSIPSIKRSEQDWIGLAVDLNTFDYSANNALNEVPFATHISGLDSAFLMIDVSGNLYNQSLAGAGNIAWGWDYSVYEMAGSYNGVGYVANAGNNAIGGLYNFYNYEIMFMRGAPSGEPLQISTSKPVTKIYKGVTSPASDTVVAEIKVPPKHDSEQVRLTFDYDVKKILYVIIPGDQNDPNFSIHRPTRDEFYAAYNNPAYQSNDVTGSYPLTSSTITPDPVTGELIVTRDIPVSDNCKIWIFVNHFAYTQSVDTIIVHTADNFYTPLELYGKGVLRADLSHVFYDLEQEKVEKVYPTAYDLANFGANTSLYSDPDVITYGIPLYKDGTVIPSPKFGYDQVKIAALDVPDHELSLTMPPPVSTRQYNPVIYMLDADYAASRPDFNERDPDETFSNLANEQNTHTFYYRASLPRKDAYTYINGFLTKDNGLPDIPVRVDIGDEIIYQITIEIPAFGPNVVTVKDKIPIGLTVDTQSISHSGSYDSFDHMITWVFTNEDPEEIILAFKAEVSAISYLGRYDNTAETYHIGALVGQTNTTYHRYMPKITEKYVDTDGNPIDLTLYPDTWTYVDLSDLTYSTKIPEISGYQVVGYFVGDTFDPLTDILILDDTVTIAPVTGDKTVYFIYEKLPDTTTLTVSKTVTGIYGNKNRAFDFTVYFEALDGNPLEGTFIYGIIGAGIIFPITSSFTTVDGKWNFSLNHGQIIVIDEVPLNCMVQIIEDPDSNYNTSIEDSENTDFGVDEDIKDTGLLLMSVDRRFDFTNNRKSVPMTSVDLSYGMTLIVVVVLNSLILLVIHTKSRFRRRLRR